MAPMWPVGCSDTPDAEICSIRPGRANIPGKHRTLNTVKLSAHKRLGTETAKCILEKQHPVPNQSLQSSTIMCCSKSFQRASRTSSRHR